MECIIFVKSDVNAYTSVQMCFEVLVVPQ